MNQWNSSILPTAAWGDMNQWNSSLLPTATRGDMNQWEQQSPTDSRTGRHEPVEQSSLLPHGAT